MDRVDVPGKGVYPMCVECCMQTNPQAWVHTHSALCRTGAERCVQQEAAVDAEKALRQVFTAYGKELERMETFKYLGWFLTMEDNDIVTVCSDLKKARKCWVQISWVLRSENAST
jgi:hypothetical protein